MDESPQDSQNPPVLSAEEIVILVSHLPDRHHPVAAKLMKLYAWLVNNAATDAR